jgi:SAM-dependent methyltransferase
MTADVERPFEAEWRARFERFARAHDDEALISGWSAAGLRRRVQLFGALLPALGVPEGGAALDLGCGGGTYVRLLAGLGHRAIGLDYSLPSLARALGADPGGKARYLAGEAYALPFGPGAFDLVLCIGVLQALAEPAPAIGEMARVLRPGGVLVVEALNGRGLAGLAKEAARRARRLPRRVKSYAPGDVRRWLAAHGLRVEAARGLCLPPRQLPLLGAALEAGPVARAVTRRWWVAALAAHSFLFAARKGPGPARPRA